MWVSSGGPVNTCSQLDWPRALAAHLWYLTHPLASVADVLHQFELGWRGSGPHGPYCAAPTPEHSAAARDLRYQLLRLYCDRASGLEQLLDPTSHTADPLDWRVSWLLARVLQALGYQHLSDSARERLHRDTASQAERAGLWPWAVFVLQHLAHHRAPAIRAVLERNIADCDEETEQFLTGELGVPLEWLAAARATLALARGNHRSRVENLMLAQQWAEAHAVMMKDIAPDCIIDHDFSYLQR